MTSAIPAVRLARLSCRNLQVQRGRCLRDSGSYESVIRLSGASQLDLQWWIHHLRQHNAVSLYPFSADIIIACDSSLQGWGAVCEGIETGGTWCSEQIGFHINYLELLSAFLALQSFAKHSVNAGVLLYLDNKTAIAYINKEGGTQSQLLNSLAQEIWSYAEKRSLRLRAEHLPGCQNVVPDRLIRTKLDFSNWRLNRTVFLKLAQLFPPFSIDLFADHTNCQVKRFLSWRPDPSAIAVDALVWNWAQEPLAYALMHSRPLLS